MARPESIGDVADRTEVVAIFNPKRFDATPALLHPYAKFVEAAVERFGGTVTKDYNGVTVTRQRTDDELVEQLRRDQSDWDARKRWYDQLAAGGEFKYPNLIPGLVEWAATEGFPELPPDAGQPADK